ncbi:MAG: iron-containing alcohol dehydrogenase [Selenomonadaceae bacterium]|nr:iron-containing alcohol dehydrogenase [Selenomonadaceae bacterium]
MQSFNFKCPTEIVFGRGAEKQVAEKIRAYGGSRVFIVYGGGSVMRTGLLPRIESYLTGAGLAFQVLGGVKPNPRLSLAREGVRLAKQFGANFILAVGGGSVIDTTKAIAHGVANPDTDIWDFWTGRAALTKTTPFGSVLTLAAAGSETSDSAVLTNEETGKKQGLNSPLNRAALAFMNPELTYTAPLRQIKAGICDIMMHTLERYFTKVKEPNLFTDLVAESLLKTMMKEARAAVKDTHDYEAMSEIMWCGSVSHSNFTELGRCKDFSCHRLGHELSGRFDVTHGESLTTLWGHWAKYVYQDDVPRFAHFAEAVFGIADGTEEERALAGIDAMVAFFRELGMPTNFTELGIGVQPKDVIVELADMLTFGDTKTIGNFHPMDKQTAIEIYERANH